MSRTTIAWCDYTFNPWIGCTKVSPGCANCYAETWGRRFGVEWGPGKPRRRTSEANWRQPLRWNGNQARIESQGAPWCTQNGKYLGPRRPRVFCGSLCDWLDPEVPILWLADLLDLIRRTPNLDWLLLTKRPQDWDSRLRHATESLLERTNVAGSFWCQMWRAGTNQSGPLVAKPPSNVWLGVSAEDQQRWDERVPILLSIPAAKRFVSVEPMLEGIDMQSGTYWSDGHGLVGDAFGQVAHRPLGRTETKTPGIDWIILGGESGPKARGCNVDWIRDGVRQCREAGVACFVKQFGTKPSGILDHISHRGDEAKRPAGFYRFLNDPKGGDPAEWPEDLRVREWPEPLLNQGKEP